MPHGVKVQVLSSAPNTSLNYTLTNTIKSDFFGLRETCVKLSKLGNYLKQLGLLNDKYLMKRGNSYYFVLKIGNSVIKKSVGMQ